MSDSIVNKIKKRKLNAEEKYEPIFGVAIDIWKEIFKIIKYNYYSQFNKTIHSLKLTCNYFRNLMLKLNIYELKIPIDNISNFKSTYEKLNWIFPEKIILSYKSTQYDNNIFLNFPSSINFIKFNYNELWNFHNIFEHLPKTIKHLDISLIEKNYMNLLNCLTNNTIETLILSWNIKEEIINGILTNMVYNSLPYTCNIINTYKKLTLPSKLLFYNEETNYYSNVLYWLCYKNYTSTVLMIFEKNITIYKNLINERDNKHNDLPIHIACKNKNIQIIQTLLKNTQDTMTIPSKNRYINQVNNECKTPLYVYCYNSYNSENIEIIHLLLENGADPNISNYIGWTPLHTCVFNRNIENIKLLLNIHESKKITSINNYYCDLNVTDNYGKTPFYISCYYGYHDITELFLQQPNCDINKSDIHQNTPLHIACKNSFRHIIELLSKQKNCLVNKKNYKGESPLHLLCKYHNDFSIKDEISLLLNNSECDVNLTDNYGKTPLYLLCEVGFNRAISVLLENCQKNCDVNKSDDEGKTPLHIACENNYLEIVEMILKNKNCVIKSDNDGFTALDYACRDQNIKIFKLFKKYNFLNI